MKKFLLYCILLSVIFLVVAILLLVPQYLMANKFKWQIPENKTTLFMGASLITLGIDDRNLENAMNISMRSEGYLYTFLKLKKLLADNNKFERIVLQCAPTDLHSNADKKIFDETNDMTHFVPLYYPYFSNEEWKIYADYKLKIIDILLSHFYKNWGVNSEQYFSKYGGFDYTNRVYEEKDFDEKSVAAIRNSTYGNKVNYEYLKKIIKFCEQNNIELIFIYLPMYKPELYYDQTYFYNALKSNFANVEFLDYSHLDIPNEYRYDGLHLNGKGAKYFTKILAERLKLTYKE